MSATWDAMVAAVRVLLWPVAILIVLALLVVFVLWLIGLPGRKKEARAAAEWRANHRAKAPDQRGRL